MLTISYPGTPPTGINYLDPTNGPQQIASSVNATAHTISAALPHFSTYVAGHTLTVSLFGVPSTAYQTVPTVIFAQVFDNTANNFSDNAPVQLTLSGAAASSSATTECPASGSDYTAGSGGMCAIVITPTAASGTIHIDASVDDGTATVTHATADITVQSLTGTSFNNADHYTVSIIPPGLAYDTTPMPVLVQVIDTTGTNLGEGVPLTFTTTGGVLTPLACTPSGADFLTVTGGICQMLLTPIAPGVVTIIASVDGATTPAQDVAAIPVLPSTGAWTVPTGTNDSAKVTTDSKNLKVTLGDPVEFDVPLYDLKTVNTDSVTIDGSGTTATTFDLSGIAANYSDQITVKGSSAADTYKLGDGFGNVTIDGDSADQLDLSTDTGSLSYSGSNVVDGISGDSLTAPAMQINTNLGSHATAVLSDITNLLNTLASAVNTAASGATAFSQALPLLDGSQATIAKIVDLTNTINGIVTQITSTVTSAQSKLQDLLGQVNAALASSSFPNIDGLPNPFKNLGSARASGTTAAGTSPSTSRRP